MTSRGSAGSSGCGPGVRARALVVGARGARAGGAASGSGAEHVVAALPDIAASVADAILKHIETLPPRTLLLVLGDHGFTIDRRGRITHGGASPEEVLVPCFAYLVGDLH